MLSDLGHGIPFRAGSFDGAISISALQWLCNADKSYHKPSKRLYQFFSTLFSALVRLILFYYTLSEAWSGVNGADLMAAQGAIGTDFYDRSILRPKHRAYHVLVDLS